ncbi:MAG: hypothetical protein ICV68_03215 [Pyrinomonadaceae bacterium]|nr:hypothetical protein [Pyrinomonadaceae bacterium]
MAVVLDFVLVALGVALTDFLTGVLFVVFALLFLAAATTGVLEFVLVALRAGALSAAVERFFKGCGLADRPAPPRFLAADVFEL